MVDLYKEIDFSQELKETPGLEPFLKAKAKEEQEELSSNQIQKPFLDRSLHEFIIVTGLPNTEASKTEQFKTFFQNKILQPTALLEKIKVIEFQLDQDGNFQGICILAFDTPANAQEGLNKLNGLKFMKYQLSAYSLYSFQQALDCPDQFTAPVNLPKRQLLEWNLENRKSLMSLQIGNKVYNYWVSHLENELQNILMKPVEEGQAPVNPENLYTPLESSTNEIVWSKNGTYMVEILPSGFRLYGGKDLNKLSFFPHPEVKKIEFSPCENYILSYNGTIIDAPNEDNFIVWQINEVKQLRVFKAKQQDIWSTFKWSYDGKYIGKIDDHKVSVYELPEMKMLEDSSKNPTSINIRNVQKFFWSSKQNILIGCSYYGPHREHDKQVSTRISMFEIPSRREFKWRTISNESSDIDIFPSANGQYVIAIIKKIKNKKSNQSSTSHTIQVANIRNKGQMDICEHEINDKIHTYSVDPYQGRIGLIYLAGELRGEQKSMIYHTQIFHIEEESKSYTIKEAGRFNNKNTNEILFSNSSGFFALINKDTGSSYCGYMETGFTRKDKGKLISEITRSYNNLSYIDSAAYDQSGRYIFTSSQKTKSFQIWTAFGDQIFKDTITDPAGIKNIIWRPRLTHLLDEKQESQIQTTYKDYKKIYEEEDDKIINKKEHERREKRDKLKQEFLEYLTAKRKEWKDTKQERVALLGFDEEDETDIVLDEFIENERVVQTEIIDEEEIEDPNN
ncbi:hypothetical protein ABPG74_002274 [Tetrahymena malaccensis]